jgi:hypothetical protein
MANSNPTDQSENLDCSAGLKQPPDWGLSGDRCHVDASITHSPHKPNTQPTYEMVNDREKRDADTAAQAYMQVV